MWLALHKSVHGIRAVNIAQLFKLVEASDTVDMVLHRQLSTNSHTKVLNGVRCSHDFTTDNQLNLADSGHQVVQESPAIYTAFYQRSALVSLKPSTD